MKKDDVKIGNVYTARVTDKLVPVRIDAANRHGGWDATNLATGKKIRIKSPQRLREEATPDQVKAAAAQGGAAAKKDAADPKKPAPKAKETPTAAKDAKAPAKPTGEAKPKKDATQAKQGDTRPKKPSGLDAAARVLAEAGQPMGVKEIVKVAFEKGYWQSNGVTPHATIYSAIIREIGQKGAESRFKKTGRGQFTARVPK